MQRLGSHEHIERFSEQDRVQLVHYKVVVCQNPVGRKVVLEETVLAIYF